MNHYKLNRKLKRKLCKLGVLTKVLKNMTADDCMELDLTDKQYNKLFTLFLFSCSKEGKKFWWNLTWKHNI